jgi:DNA-binding transcriptional LysR family regulator
MQTLNDLNDLRLVAAILETGSLSGAARRLDINHATAFRRLQKIESQLGVRLFDRLDGHYTATEAGRELANAGAVIETMAGESLRKVAGRDLQPGGVVRITTTETLTGRFVGPIALACREKYPDIRLQLSVANMVYNLSRRDADIALRPASRPPEELIGKRIGRIAHAVYGARSYLRGKRKNLALRDHDWIAMDDSMGEHFSLKWLAKILSPERARLRVSSYPGIYRACAAGLGLAVLPCFVGDDDSALKRVTDLLDDCQTDLWLLTHPDLRNTVRIKAVSQIIQDVLRDALPLLEGKKGEAVR